MSSKNKTMPIEARNINMVFQDFALWPHMKARDNILYGLKVKKTDKSIMQEKLDEVVGLLHLEGLLDQYPAELSGGQQQRVAIARALITEPSIILLDEPLCNLDIQLRIEMRTEMAQLFHSLKTTVFHVTHDPSEAFAMADRIIIMNGGKIDQIDTPSVCYIQPKTSMVAGLLGAGNCLTKGTLEEKNGIGCKVRIGNEIVECSDFLSEKAEKGDAVELRFRPEDCIFISCREENALPVIVIMSSFEGGLYRVKVETETGEGLCLLNAEYLKEGQTGYARISKERLYAYEKVSS